MRNVKVFEAMRSLPMESTSDITIETYTNECMVSVTSGDKARSHVKWYGWEESDGGGNVRYVRDILLKEGNKPKKGAANQVTLTVVRYERASTSPETAEVMEADIDTTDTENMETDSEEIESVTNKVPTKLTASPVSNMGGTATNANTDTEDFDSMVEDSFLLLFGEEERAAAEEEGARPAAQPQE